MHAPPNTRGFSLVELMVAVALLAMLLGLATPSFVTWVQNAKTRTASDSLQNGLRLAQAEAVRRHRQIVLFRTADAACTNAATPNASGSFWVLRTVAMVAGEPVTTVQCGQLAEASDGVLVSGPTAVCFSGIGRLVANGDPGIGGTGCTVTGGTQSFEVSNPRGDRPLRVTVALAGSVRMCDPQRVLSSSQPDGCPT
jgi:type IV fimbrial biogenesis protein FimT